MADQQVPVTRTVITLRDYVRAVVAAWPTISTDPCPKEAPAVLWAQHVAETGNRASWNFNVANVKWTKGCGLDFMCLNGVWEGVTPAQAAQLIAAGRAIADPSPDHAKAVDPKGTGLKVSVIFPPPQPECRFRAYPDLATAMASHLSMLFRRFGKGWPFVLSGDVDGFADAIHAQGYFTASPIAYAGNMRRPFLEAMTSSAWDDATEAQSQDAIVTLPALDNPASSPSMVVQPIVHVLSYDGEPEEK